MPIVEQLAKSLVCIDEVGKQLKIPLGRFRVGIDSHALCKDRTKARSRRLMRLTISRAKMVHFHLIRSGVRPGILLPRGFGGTAPLAMISR